VIFPRASSKCDGTTGSALLAPPRELELQGHGRKQVAQVPADQHRVVALG